MDNAPFRIREIDHIVLRTRAPSRLQAFYCDVLGCTIEKLQPAIGLTQLRAGRSLIDLFEREDGAHGEARNMDHLCLRVEPFDADAIVAFLRTQGIEPGPLEDRYGAEGAGPSLYISDPDGNTVELKGPPAAQARSSL